MFASLVLVAVLAATANADHTITLRNNCAWGVGMTLSNYPHNGVDYTGPAIPDIAAGTSWDLTVPTGVSIKFWLLLTFPGRICDRPPNSGCENDCFGGIAFGEAACSMTEACSAVENFDTRELTSFQWTFDSANLGGQDDYDISNIQGFSVVRIFLDPPSTLWLKASYSGATNSPKQRLLSRYMYE
ncbi:hypothetical protein B0H11DRAFT_2239193 [Mycena galericulata]|nr:hypothetical protein B0H11DRAFT_2239193 [Mycena galericulata]